MRTVVERLEKAIEIHSSNERQKLAYGSGNRVCIKAVLSDVSLPTEGYINDNDAHRLVAKVITEKTGYTGSTSNVICGFNNSAATKKTLLEIYKEALIRARKAEATKAAA